MRAEVINGLLLGDFSPDPGWFPAVRIRGARITGRLDLMGATIRHALVCEGCWFDQPPRFVETSTKTVRIISSRMPGFNGARMRTEGLFNLYGSAIEGLLRLDRAHVTGEIFLMGAQVGDGTGEAIAAEGLIVDGDMQCNGVAAAAGGCACLREPAGTPRTGYQRGLDAVYSVVHVWPGSTSPRS